MKKLSLGLVLLTAGSVAFAQTSVRSSGDRGGPPAVERADRPGVTSSTVPTPGAANTPALPSTATPPSTRSNRQYARDSKAARKADKVARKAEKRRHKAAKKAAKRAARNA